MHCWSGISFALHIKGRYSDADVSTDTSQQESPGFNSNLHVLPVAAWVPSGYSGFLPQSNNMHVRLMR